MPSPSTVAATAPPSSDFLVSHQGRKAFLLMNAACIPIVFFVSLLQGTFNPFIGLAVAAIGMALTIFGTSPERRHFTPLVWAVWFNAGCLMSFVDLLVNESDYRTRATPMTGSFAYTNGEMWQVVLYLTLGAISIVAGTLVSERYLARHRPATIARRRFNSPEAALGSIAIWTIAGIALSLFMFANQIGRTGLVDQSQLPFRLAGILSYSRLYLVPCLGFLIFDMLMVSRMSRYAMAMVLALLVVGFIGSITALSRGYLGFLAIMMSLYLVANLGRYGIAIKAFFKIIPGIAIVLAISIFYVNALRTSGFSGKTVDVQNALYVLQESPLEDFSNMLIPIFQMAASRIGGLQELLAVLSAPNAWHVWNPYHIFVENPDITNWLQLRVFGFMTVTTDTISTGNSFSLWGTLALSGSLPILAAWTMLCVGLIMLIEETFIRLGTPTIAQTLAVYVGIQAWGFANVSVASKIAGMMLIVYLTTRIFLRFCAAPWAIASPTTRVPTTLASGTGRP